MENKEVTIDEQLYIINNRTGDIQVTSQETYESALCFLKDIKDYTSRVQWHFKPMKDAALKNLEVVRKEEDKYLGSAKKADASVRTICNAYIQAEKDKEEAAQKAANEKAEREAEKKKKNLEQRASYAKKGETKERLEEDAANVYAEPVTVKPTVKQTTKLDGVTGSIKTDTSVTVTDISLLIKAINDGKVPNTVIKVLDGKLKSYIKATNLKNGDVPGVFIKKSSSVVIR